MWANKDYILFVLFYFVIQISCGVELAFSPAQLCMDWVLVYGILPHRDIIFFKFYWILRYKNLSRVDYYVLYSLKNCVVVRVLIMILLIPCLILSLSLTNTLKNDYYQCFILSHTVTFSVCMLLHLFITDFFVIRVDTTDVNFVCYIFSHR